MRSFLFVTCFIICAVTTNAQIVSLADVSGYVGKTVTVYGKVDDGRFLNSSSNQPTLLNMGGKYPNQKLTIVIYGPSRVNFGYKPEEMLVNKNVYVTGKVELYKGKPQIQVQTPFEIAFTAPGSAASANAVSSISSNTSDRNQNNRKERKVEESPAKKINDEKSTPAPMEKSNRPAVAESKRVEPVKRTEPKPVMALETPRVQTTSLGGEIITSSDLTLRGGPGNKFTTIGNIKKGTVVTIVSTSYGWTKIAQKSSTSNASALAGYVKSEKLN